MRLSVMFITAVCVLFLEINLLLEFRSVLPQTESYFHLQVFIFQRKFSWQKSNNRVEM